MNPRRHSYFRICQHSYQPLAILALLTQPPPTGATPACPTTPAYRRNPGLPGTKWGTKPLCLFAKNG